MLNSDIPHTVLSTKGRSFYLASRLMGKPYRERVTLLYAFCRYVDDLVDEQPSKEISQANINHIKSDLLSGQSKDVNVNSLLGLIKHLNVPIDVLNTLVSGVESDLNLRQIKTEPELIQYAYQVAGTVGILMLHLLDVKDRKALPFAIDLGIAMQLTNIARDIGEDAIRGRIYLPASWLNGIASDDILMPTEQNADALRHATRRLLNLAEQYYESACQGLHFLPIKSRLSIIAALIIYREIGTAIKKNQFNSWKSRVVVSPALKLVCLAKTIFVFILSLRPNYCPCDHSEILHQPLHELWKHQKSLNKLRTL